MMNLADFFIFVLVKYIFLNYGKSIIDNNIGFGFIFLYKEKYNFGKNGFHIKQ